MAKLLTVSRLLRIQQRNYGYVHVPKKRKPHLLGHGSEWRKCYAVHPHTQISQPLNSYQSLTGTIIEEGLPISLSNEECLKEEVEWFEERLEAANNDQHGKNLKGKKGVERVKNILSSAIVGLWMNGAKHLLESTLTYNPRVETYWRCNGINLLSVTHPLFILHCSQPLNLFSDPTIYIDNPLSLIDNPRHLGLFEHSFDQITPFSGCHRYSPTGYTHTVFFSDLRASSQEQLLAHSLMQLFSQTTAECIQNGYPLDEDLSYPLAVQGVMTNDHSLTFLTFQLNTLDMRRNALEKRRNVMWVGPTMNLFTDDGINRQCSQLLAQFIMQSPTRNKPAISGFGLKTDSVSI